MLLILLVLLIHLQFSLLFYIIRNTPMPQMNSEMATNISLPVGAIARLHCTVSNVDQPAVFVNHLIKNHYHRIFSDLFHPLVWLPHHKHRPENVQQRSQIQCDPLHKQQSMGSHDPRSATKWQGGVSMPGSNIYRRENKLILASGPPTYGEHNRFNREAFDPRRQHQHNLWVKRQRSAARIPVLVPQFRIVNKCLWSDRLGIGFSCFVFCCLDFVSLVSNFNFEVYFKTYTHVTVKTI